MCCDPLTPCESCEALRVLRSRLSRSGHRQGEGNVVFTRTDGRKVTLKNVRVDSIGPGAESYGVVGVEYFDNDEVIHVPFVESWVIQYE